jgi:hypothetical protein
MPLEQGVTMTSLELNDSSGGGGNENGSDM